MCKVSEVITKEEIEKIRPHLPDIEEYMEKDLREFLVELGYEITSEMDEEFELTPTSRMLERIMDELILRANQKSED